MASKLPIDVTKTFFDTKTIITPAKLEEVKLNLMSRHPASLITAVSWIKQNLKGASDSKRECLIEALIENDTLTYLCENIACSNGLLYTDILEIIRKLIPSRKFYQKNLAKLATSSIIRSSFTMAKKMEPHEETLTFVTLTLRQLLDGASSAQVSLDKVYNPDQMVAFLERLDPTRSSNYLLRSSAAKMLCLVMSDLKLPIEATIQSSLFKAFRDSLLCMGHIVLELSDANKNELIKTPLEIICSICAIGSRFCEELEGENFAKEITLTMIDTVIPHFKRTKFDRVAYRRSLKNFISCLNEILQLKNSDKELANVLATHGYLKYFLGIPTSRMSVSLLVSQIIAKLAEDDFSHDESSAELTEFQKRINEEILALPSDADIFRIPSINLSISDGFLILLYYHSQKTHEYDLVELLPAISLKLIVMMPNANEKSHLVLKATWFLFMVSSKGCQTKSLAFYLEAVTNLVQLLERHGLQKCYTHDRILLDCSINCQDFPVDLQYETVRLWLDFGGDIKPLLESPKIDLIDYCLVRTIETGSEKLVNRSLEVLAELKSDKPRWIRIGVRVWERLPRALSLCSVNTAINTKELLKITRGTKPGEISLEIYRECAIILAKILESEELEIDLKILLLQNVNTLVEVALERNSPAIVKSCVEHAQLFTILLDKGLGRVNWPYSACCMNLIVNILESQRKFGLESPESDVVKIEPLKILVLLGRSNYELSSAAVRLLIIFLNREEKFSLSVALNDFENVAAADETISAWYKMLQLLLPEKQIEDWHLIYRCLISVLVICEELELHKTLHYLGDYSGTYDLVRLTIDHEYTNPYFFKFLETWLHYAQKYQSKNIVAMEYALDLRDLGIGPSEFEKIIQMINNFRDKLQN